MYLSIIHLLSFFAENASKKPESCAAVGASQLIMIGALFAIFYFFLIRPQQKKAKAHQEMLKSTKKGDKIYTSGGLIGTVTGVADKFLTVEISEKVRVRILRSHVAGTHEATGFEKKSEGKK